MLKNMMFPKFVQLWLLFLVGQNSAQYLAIIESICELEYNLLLRIITNKQYLFSKEEPGQNIVY